MQLMATTLKQQLVVMVWVCLVLRWVLWASW
jgi:hypothetical protein